MDIIVRSNDNALTGLVNDLDQLGRVTSCFHNSIAMSLALDGATVTTREVKRRFDICVKIFKELRGDVKWGVSRIIDYLPEYLRAELDGEPWEPDTRRCWVPSDG